MIGLLDVVGLLRFVSVEQIVRGTVRFAARVGQGDEGGIELLDDAIDLVIIGNGPSVLPRHLTHLSVDERRGGRRFTQGEPLDDRFEFGWQSMWLSSIPARTPGEPGQTMAPVLGEPELEGAQRGALVTGHMGQWHAVFRAGLEDAIALQGPGTFFRRQRRE